MAIRCGGDDGLGIYAANQIAENNPDGSVHFITCHQLTPELAEIIAQYNRILFIDANVKGVPGEFHYQIVEPSAFSTPSCIHHLDPSTLLAYTKELYGRQPEAIALSITGACFDYREELSPEVKAALPQLYQHAQDFIQQK